MHPKPLSRLTALLACLLIFSLAAQADSDPKASESKTQIFGPFEAIELDPAYIIGAKVDDAGKIWIKLRPEVKERELQLKISMQKDAAYRNWFTGSPVLVSAANQGKEPNAWTDWIETSAKYIEYWMDGKRILHLKRIQR